MDITNNIGKTLDDGQEFRIVFCDDSKAFDKVWHRGLLHILKNYGFGGNIIICLEHYLQDRFKRVAIWMLYILAVYKCRCSTKFYISSSSLFIIHK